MTEPHHPGDDATGAGPPARPDQWRALDLSETVAALAQVATGAQSVVASLEQIAELAVAAIPGADGASVTMRDPHQAETVVVSAEFVRRVDDAQYGLQEGPCVTAAAEAVTVVSGALATDPRWPRFGPRAREFGVNSALSPPLVFAGEVLGALNVYAWAPDAFDLQARTIGETFASVAAVTVFNARRVAQAERVTRQLQEALTSRAVIDQAIGILMSRQGGTADDAFARLRQLSQHQNVKLPVVAQGLIDDAVRRARARHAGGS